MRERSRVRTSLWRLERVIKISRGGKGPESDLEEGEVGGKNRQPCFFAPTFLGGSFEEDDCDVP